LLSPPNTVPRAKRAGRLRDARLRYLIKRNDCARISTVATAPGSDFVLRTVGGISNCIGTEFYQRITLSIRIVSRRLPLPELTTDSTTKHFSPVAIALSTLEKRGAVGTHARARKPFELITGAFRFVFHVVLAQTQFTLNRSSPSTSLLLLQPRCVPLHNPVWELRKVWSLSAF